MSSIDDYTMAHWRRVFKELLRQPDSIFNNQYQDCPLCSAAGAFKGQEMDPGYHMTCGGCGGMDGKGGIITEFEYAARILKVGPVAARAQIDEFLGFEVARPARRPSLLDQLQALPDDWALVAVGNNKRPYQDAWQERHLNKTQAAAEVIAGRAKAIGVACGPPSGGLLFVDHDGISASEVLEQFGAPLSSLPPTVKVTSGRDGRLQLIYRVPEEFWPGLANRKVFKSGKTDSEGKAEMLELRWAGHQSVVIGAHPSTSGYRWLKGASPQEAAIADAPMVLIELLLSTPKPEPAPLLAMAQQRAPSAHDLPLLEFITRESRELVESGGSPGSWNDDQIKLALDLKGTEAWIQQQGHRSDISARDAFADHIQAARGKAADFDERKAWHRFDGAEKLNPTAGTPEDNLLKRLAFHTRTKRPALVPTKTRQEQQQQPADAPPPPERKGNQPFVCLGFDADGFFYQPASTGQVVRISGASHTGLNLCRLAPLPYWEALYPSKTGINWTAAGSDLFEAQARVGMFNPDTLRGRGVWWDQGRPILHLGDRLLVNGIEQPITGVSGSRAHYQRGRALEGPGDASPLTDAEAHQLLAIAEEFQWDVPASSLLLAGWVVLGPICGSLSWRPHIWLTAGAGTGKSTILGRYVTPLLGDIGLIVAGNTSEAGIRQDLRCDALPVVFDESESNERQDQQRIQSVLALARIASSESKGAVLKGSSGGEVTRYRMRSMFMMCSITTALKQGADRRRFAQLTLRAKAGQSDADREAHWKRLEKMLDDTVTEETARRLLARSVSLIPVIHQSAKVFVRVAARHFGSQALGDQYGTLLAGAWSLMSAEPVTEEQAQTLISQNNWSSYQENVEQPDEERCLQRILQHQLRVEGAERTETRNIRELVDLVASPGADMLSSISPAQAEKVLGRHGIRVDDGRLLVSNTAEALARILQDSAWACSWSTILTRLQGAEKVGSTRFSGVGVTRAVAVPIDQL